ncbi:LysR family transcriptional regulator [Salipiger sp.]|uniref:LysR family transcriptional regulator n=1 Tax=Salipiger sp. TaxID=2078585 RepID=UPI003A976D07
MFELNQLRCFVAVAAEMNFHRAAERLNMTQPPLSRQIQLLERNIDVQLFDRSGRNIRLTAGGRRFLVEAQDLLRRAEEAALATRATVSGTVGSVTLGFVPIANLALLPRVVPLLKTELPGVHVALREMLTVNQMEALESGQIDLGLLRMPRDRRNMLMYPLFEESYVLAIHEDHPFCNRDTLVLEDLNDQEFLMYAPSDGWYGYDIFNGIFAAHEIRPRFVQYFGQTLTMLSLVNAGGGMALVPESSRILGFAHVRFRAIELPIRATSAYYLACTPAGVEDPAVERVRDLLLAEFSDAP